MKSELRGGEWLIAYGTLSEKREEERLMAYSVWRTLSEKREEKGRMAYRV